MGKVNSGLITKPLNVADVKSIDSFLGQDNGGSTTGAWDEEIKAFIDPSTMKSLFYSEDWVFILVDLIAAEISRIPMRVYQKEIVNGRERIERDDDHYLNFLLTKPNKNQDYTTWMYLHTVEDTLMGNAIQWYSRSTNQMIILPAETVYLDIDSETCKLKHYLVNAEEDCSGMAGMKFHPDTVLHQRRPNPMSALWGLSPFVPNRKSLLFNRYTMDYLNAFYLRQATGQIALSVDKHVNVDTAIALMRSFELSAVGRRNTRRTMFLPKGVTANRISTTMAEQSMVEIMGINREKILNILRIPKHALSLAENGSLGSEEHKMALKFMYSNALIPIMERIAGTFTNFFQVDLGHDHFFKFDLSEIEILKEDQIQTSELATKKLEFMTVNEVREELFDLEPVAGGDIVPGIERVSQGFNRFSNKPSQEPIAEQDEASEEQQEDKSVKKTIHVGDLRVKKLMIKYGEWFELSQKSIQDEIETKEEKIFSIHMDLFEKQAAIALEEFRKVFKDKKSIQFKDAQGSRRRYRKNVEKAFQKLEEQYSKDYFGVLEATVEEGYDTNLKAVFNDDARNEILALKIRDADKRRAMLSGRSDDVFSDISNTTTDKLLNTIRQGIEDKKGVDDIAISILDQFKNVSPSRANTIARTETLTAVSLGKKAALDNATEVIPDLLKVWINSNDARVRDSHVKLQGEPQKADDPFSNGLDYPRDPNSDQPEEVINCRCDMLMVPPEDLDDLDL